MRNRVPSYVRTLEYTYAILDKIGVYRFEHRPLRRIDMIMGVNNINSHSITK